MPKNRIITALAVTALFMGLLPASALADYREDFSKSLPLKAGEIFSLRNVNGDVTVTTWKENSVDIKAVKVARRNKEELKEVEIRVEAKAGSASVEAVWPKFPRRARVSVDFDIKVPEGVILDEVRTVNGGISITGRYERAGAKTTNGSITVENSSGGLVARTTNGSIRVRGFEGRIEAGTTNGNIRLEGLTFKDGVSAGTTNGSITLALASPETVNADLLARTTNGSITVDFSVTVQNLSQSRRRVEAKIGQGGPEISLHTTNGSIKLTK